MFSIFLTHMSNFVLIKCYLLFDRQTNFLCIILDYKNLKNLGISSLICLNLSLNFVSIENVRRKCNSMINLSKFTLKKKKKILNEFVVLDYHQVYCQTLSNIIIIRFCMF